MTRRTSLLIAAGIAVAALAGGGVYAMQADEAGELRATGQVGEQWDGYLGVVGSAGAEIRARVDAINIKRRALYTQQASAANAMVESMAVATGCKLLATKVGPGQYYKLPDGVWRQREGSAPIALPANCP